VPLPLDESNNTHASRYRLTVVASSMVDVVGSAGGWLCDRARAGWDVNVVLADAQDARPLTILGATALGVDGELSDVVRVVSYGGTLAISAQVLATDERVRGHVVNILKRRVADVTVWGRDWPSGFGREGDRVEHKLSSAARAFKALALGAAAAPQSSIGPTETLFNLGTESFRPLYAV
jgi:hypothetical protein